MTEIKQFTTIFVNGYIVRGEKTVLYDTGALYTPERLPGLLEELDVKPEEIDLIIISHAHWDHAQLVRAWKELTGAKVLCHRACADFVRGEKKKEPYYIFSSQGRACQPYMDYMLQNSLFQIEGVEPDIIVGDEDFDLHPYGIAGKLAHTPGHDDSCIALVLDDRRALINDMAIDPHDLDVIADQFPAGSYSLNWICTDEELIKQSMVKLLDLADTFYGGHHGELPRDVFEALVD